MRIEAMTGIHLPESQCRRVMKKMGLRVKETAPLPGKAGSQLQFEFHQRELQPRLQEASEGRRNVFLVDSANFVLGAFPGLVWCFARPFIKTAPGRQRYSVLGAIDSHSKELISIKTTGCVNAELVGALLARIRQCHPGEKVTLVMDNARYQQCKAVMSIAADLDIELLFRPAHSPSLNLIERLWKLVKRRCLTNKYYANFEGFRNAIDKCLAELGGVAKTELDSPITLNLQFFANSKS